MRRRNLLALALAAGARLARAAEAPYPSGPVHLCIPGGAGSYPDQVGRLLADGLAAAWHQPVVVENRPGAGGLVAMTAFLKAAPDGHALALATMSQLVFNPALFRELPYDPQRDLAPVGTVLSGSLMLVAHPSLRIDSLSALAAAARTRPEGLAIAVPASASPPHVVLLMLMRALRLPLTVVPFRTGSDALAQVGAGQVPLFIDAVPVVEAQVAAGRLVGVAVTGSERVARFPAVATVQEQGVPGFRAETWLGVVARRGTPEAIVERVHAELARVVHGAAFLQFAASAGGQPLADSPQAFAERIRADQARWQPIIREARLTAG